MLNEGGMPAEQIMQMLNLAFSKEQNVWKPNRYISSSSTEKGLEVSGQQRDMVVKWLAGMNDFLRFSPETIFTTVSLLDSFLHSVKAHPKYLYCIAVTCFYVAIKITEEDEVIPTAAQLLDVSHCGCSVAELLRMERVILGKLNWSLKHVTSLDFLHIFHGLLALNCPDLLDMSQVGSGNLLVWLGVKLKASLPYCKLAAFRPSTLALSLISLELELHCKNWVPLTVTLQKLAEISYTDLVYCREELSQIMFNLYGQAQTFKSFLNSSKYLHPVKHKMEQTDVEDIYDSIKRLYGEDGTTHSCTAAVHDSRSQLTDHQFTSVTAV